MNIELLILILAVLFSAGLLAYCYIMAAGGPRVAWWALQARHYQRTARAHLHEAELYERDAITAENNARRHRERAQAALWNAERARHKNQGALYQ